MQALLERLLPLLRCPECHQPALESGEAAVRCVHCGEVYPYRQGILTLLAPRDHPLARKSFGKVAARAYDLSGARGGIRGLLAGSTADEVRAYTRGFALEAADLVIDVGCGTGNYTHEFARQVPEGIAIGIDLSLDMLELFVQHVQSQTLTNAVAIQASAENLPFQDGSLSKIFNGCLHHLAPRIAPGLAEACRCLSSKGILYGITQMSARSSGWRWLQELSLGGTGHPVDPELLEETLKRAGFADVTVAAAGLARFFFGTYRAVKSDAPTSLWREMAAEH